LHSNNNYIGIINGKDKRVLGKRIDNDLPSVLSVLEPFQNEQAPKRLPRHLLALCADYILGDGMGNSKAFFTDSDEMGF